MSIGMARAFVIVAVIAATIGLLPRSLAWVFHGDDRQPSHSTRVGSLKVDLPEGTALSTAVLVDGCGILTNFHAVFGPWYVTALRPASREFSGIFTLTEVTLPDGTKPAARAIPVIWGEYRGPDRQLRMPHQDWAYLVLDRCLGLEYGYLVPRALDLQDSKGAVGGFAALGYSTGRQMMDPACSIHAWSGAGSWLHDCALEAGDSGGPIVPRGTLSIVALSASVRGDSHCSTGGSPKVPGRLCANVAVALTRDIIARIEAARTAVGVQRALIAAGYDAGPIGAIDEPRAIAAIRQAQSDMGWAATGQPTDALRKILWLNLRTS